MGDLPILFSGPMVRSLLDGRKTQTRRILPAGNVYADLASEGAEDFELRGWHVFSREDALCAAKVRIAPSDRLWVRETWRPIHSGDPGRGAQYRADHPDDWRDDTKWKPSIHMPRWASRITLTVTDVKVERLQDISEADAIAEGCSPAGDGKFFIPGQYRYTSPREPRTAISAVSAFGSLWRQINGDASWEADSWVAAYTFTVALGNIDQIARAA